MDRFDVLLLLGIALITIGCGLIYFPLGLIAGGAGCIAIALVGARISLTPPAAATKPGNVATSGKEKS